MPKEYLEILGKITIPEDDGKHLWEGIKKGTVIGASDGSLITVQQKSKGGYSYSVQQYNDNEQRIIGHGATPLSSKTSSMTSEKYGVLATLICIKCIFQQHHDGRHLEKNICVITDNLEVVNRANERPRPMNISETMVPEYDLWVLLWELIDAIPIKIKIQWIKGHQNENEKNEIIHGPFSREAQLNIEMDKVAADGVKLHEEAVYRRPLYYSTKMAIYDDEGYQINDISSFLNEHINGPIIEKYIKNKYGWNNNNINTVDWDALSASLKRYSPFQYSKMIQIMYNWQNVGRQKEKLLNIMMDCARQDVKNQRHTATTYTAVTRK